MSAGRPKSKFDLPDGWKETILGEYENGASDIEVRQTIRKMRGSFSQDLFERWILDEEEFSVAIKDGRDSSIAWWLQIGRDAAIGKQKINATVWIFNMKNRAGWSDKQEVSGPNGSNPLLEAAQMFAKTVQGLNE